MNMEKQVILQLLDKFHPNRHKCMCCGKDIIYDNTKIGPKKGNITGSSFNSVKKIGDTEYHLQVCQECLLKKYPNIKNLSKTFNVMSEMTKFAFQIPDQVFESSRAKYAMTEKHMIEKYGKEAGKKKWDEYCKRQAETNTFEYKQEKYGWTKEQFDEYNRNRACTLENFIDRWGKKEGEKRWNEYVDKQIITKSKEWFVKEHGEDAWNEMNSKKVLSLENFIRKYGSKEGQIRYDSYLENNHNLYSKSSQEFFNKLDKYLGKKYKTYYATKNREQGIKCGIKHYMMDYYIPELKLDIEFNGDYWHGNPNKFKPTDVCHPKNNEITAEYLQKKDQKRYSDLKKYHDINTVVVWESDYNYNFDFEKFIKEELKINL